MADTLSQSALSERMARVRSRDTRPEMVVRRFLHGMGFRYRLHDGRLPGSPDLSFPSRHKVVFVHGCFWHRHADPDCKLSRLPKSKLDFWMPKLEGNRIRDTRDQTELDAIGWKSMVVWECKLRHMEQLKNKIVAFLKEGMA